MISQRKYYIVNLNMSRDRVMVAVIIRAVLVTEVSDGDMSDWDSGVLAV